MKAWITGLIAGETVEPLAVPFVVFGEHRAGQVDCQYDIVTLTAHFPLVLDLLRPAQTSDEEQNQANQGNESGPAGKGLQTCPVPGGGKRYQKDRNARATSPPKHKGDSDQCQKPASGSAIR